MTRCRCMSTYRGDHPLRASIRDEWAGRGGGGRGGGGGPLRRVGSSVGHLHVGVALCGTANFDELFSPFSRRIGRPRGIGDSQVLRSQSICSSGKQHSSRFWKTESGKNAKGEQPTGVLTHVSIQITVVGSLEAFALFLVKSRRSAPGNFAAYGWPLSSSATWARRRTGGV